MSQVCCTLSGFHMALEDRYLLGALFKGVSTIHNCGPTEDGHPQARVGGDY